MHRGTPAGLASVRQPALVDPWLISPDPRSVAQRTDGKGGGRENVAGGAEKAVDGVLKASVVGGGTGGVSLLAELASDEVEPYIESQRAALAQQRDTLLRPFARFRKS